MVCDIVKSVKDMPWTEKEEGNEWIRPLKCLIKESCTFLPLCLWCYHVLSFLVGGGSSDVDDVDDNDGYAEDCVEYKK